MFSLSQSRHIRGHAGEPLPTVWEGIEFIKGQLVLVAAGPGCGKSAFILSMALKSQTPTFYLSADSDAFTQLTRAICIVTGKTQAEAAAMVLNDDIIPSEVTNLPVLFDYTGNPTVGQLDAQIMAYEEVYGVYPELIVVDNITNVRGVVDEGDDDPFGGLEQLLDYLSSMARTTGACVVGMHHVTGPYNDADKPIPLSGVKGQVGRVPSTILTLHREQVDYGPDMLNVSPVKKRGGKADPSGLTYTELLFHGETMSIAST